jgi:hypothetical protein
VRDHVTHDEDSFSDSDEFIITQSAADVKQPYKA